MTIGKIRTALYTSAKILGDVNAIKRGTVKQRVANRVVGKVTGRLLGGIFKNVQIKWQKKKEHSKEYTQCFIAGQGYNTADIPMPREWYSDYFANADVPDDLTVNDDPDKIKLHYENDVCIKTFKLTVHIDD